MALVPEKIDILPTLLSKIIPIPKELSLLIISYIPPVHHLFYEYYPKETIDTSFFLSLTVFFSFFPIKYIRYQKPLIDDPYKLTNSWNNRFLLYNPNITVDYIDRFLPEMKKSYLSRNPVPPEKMLQYPEEYDHLGETAISLNPYLTLSYVLAHSDIFPGYNSYNRWAISQNKKFFTNKWDWWAISQNKNITLHDIETHPNLPWDRYGILLNPNVTIPFMQQHPNIFGKVIDWWGYSSNPNLSWDFVIAHPEIKWNWQGLSENTNIPLSMIIAHPEKDWEWIAISERPNITMDDIINYPKANWDWRKLSQNQNFSLEFVSTLYLKYMTKKIKSSWGGLDPEILAKNLGAVEKIFYVNNAFIIFVIPLLPFIPTDLLTIIKSYL